MNLNINDAQKLLVARLEDAFKRAERGELVCGNFLSPGEAAFALAYLKETRRADRTFFYGGYKDAERRRLFVLPTFLADMDGSPEEKAKTYFPEEFTDSVRAVLIKGSMYRALSHRDYLGSILALGIDRATVGDIAILDDHSAVIFCTSKIHEFLMHSIDRIASDKVTVKEYAPDGELEVKKSFMPISDTVASDRLDCVVAALTNLSRDKAQNLIRSGLCELDYLPETRCDRQITPPCTVTARGYGKYNILSFDGETRRGRLRLIAQKYV